MKTADGYILRVGSVVSFADRDLKGYVGQVVKIITQRLVRVEWKRPQPFTIALPPAELVVLDRGSVGVVDRTAA